MSLHNENQPIVMSRLVGEKITDEVNTYLVLNYERANDGYEVITIIKDNQSIRVGRMELITYFKYGDSFWNVDFPFPGVCDE